MSLHWMNLLILLVLVSTCAVAQSPDTLSGSVIIKLKEMREAHEAEVEKMKSVIEKQNEIIQNLTDLINQTSLKIIVDEQKGIIDEQRSEFDGLETVIEDQKRIIQNLTDVIEEASLKNIVDEQRSFIQAMNTTMVERITTLEDDVENQNQGAEDVAAITARIEATEGDLEELNTTMRGRLDIVEDDVAAVSGRVNSAEGTVITLSGRVDDVEADLATNSVTSMNTRLTAVESDVTLLKTDVAFKVHFSSQPTYTANNVYKFDAVVTNIGGGYVSNSGDPNFGKFIAPYSGLYQFMLTIGSLNVNTDNHGEIVLNGATVLCSGFARNEWQNGMCPGVARLNAGDQVYARVPSDQTRDATFWAEHTIFTGVLLRRHA